MQFPPATITRVRAFLLVRFGFGLNLPTEDPGFDKKLGYIGESIAISFLTQQGMKLRERNWKWRGGELDLILQAGRELLFVEVKTSLQRIASQDLKENLHLRFTDRQALVLERGARRYIMSHQLELLRSGVAQAKIVGAYVIVSPHGLKAIHYLPHIFQTETLLDSSW